MFIPRLAAAVALTALAATAIPGSAAAAGHGHALPEHVFAPYFQTYNPGDPAEQAAASGARYLTMAFLQTPVAGSCEATWDGDPNRPISWAQYGDSIAKLRATGGDVIASYGGGDASGHGTDIADSCTDVDKIAESFEKVITTYDITRIDLDVEGPMPKNLPGVDRRNKAIAQVEKWAAAHGRTIQFDYTVPTNVDGITQDSKNMLANAVANGADVHIVNIMTFDYYDNKPHEMADDTRTAANSLLAELRVLHPGTPDHKLWQQVGIIEMIGVDDYGSGGETGPLEIFTPRDAVDITVWSWLHNIGSLSFWALGRDSACPGQHSDKCSGVQQAPWQYTRTMTPFTHN
ncbi:glycosyl hydrolase family 18 protein [Kutzneria sp. NPDC052558]|uniref:glycosyl hydrolase family 18 protein n=1 Tax=Kutzneria sp. NPDC052558 TaxID=3364121 RepID=UPI0037C8E001